VSLLLNKVIFVLYIYIIYILYRFGLQLTSILHKSPSMTIIITFYDQIFYIRTSTRFIGHSELYRLSVKVDQKSYFISVDSDLVLLKHDFIYKLNYRIILNVYSNLKNNANIKYIIVRLFH